ncbi:MAG: hypothetical protein L0Z62_45325 [Gemmataceae bacterium]|nr:hypothetical protein [Gemmataceae bacterium]
MTEREMIEYARRCLEEFNALPPEEQLRAMIAWGTINEKGEVLMSGKANGQQGEEPAGATPGQPASASPPRNGPDQPT